MIDIKIIILLIGVFLFTIGFINQYKSDIQNKYIYKMLPRNVYDEVFFSLPVSTYDENLYDDMNPEYELNQENDYKTLFIKPNINNKDYNYNIGWKKGVKTIYEDKERERNAENIEISNYDSSYY